VQETVEEKQKEVAVLTELLDRALADLKTMKGTLMSLQKANQVEEPKIYSANIQTAIQKKDIASVKYSIFRDPLILKAPLCENAGTPLLQTTLQGKEEIARGNPEGGGCQGERLMNVDAIDRIPLRNESMLSQTEYYSRREKRLLFDQVY
jgi:hypothetical protein